MPALPLRRALVSLCYGTGLMFVYLVPVGTDRYELYCEDCAEAPALEDVPSGAVARLAGRFRVWLARVEQERRNAPAHLRGDRTGLVRKLKSRAVSKLAEIVAEQRLLWRLRKVSEARALLPDDMSDAAADGVIRRALQRDADRHRTWLVVYALAFAVSGLVAIVPGPNVLAYYFAFRLAGHYLSMKGARHGLTGVTWFHEQSRALAELRHVLALPGPERERQVRQIASGLRLPHLAGFVKRVAVRGA